MLVETAQGATPRLPESSGNSFNARQNPLNRPPKQSAPQFGKELAQSKIPVNTDLNVGKMFVISEIAPLMREKNRSTVPPLTSRLSASLSSTKPFINSLLLALSAK
jgi:hypothetical protein